MAIDPLTGLEAITEFLEFYLPLFLLLIPDIFQIIGLLGLFWYSVQLFVTHHFGIHVKSILKSIFVFSVGLLMDLII